MDDAEPHAEAEEGGALIRVSGSWDLAHFRQAKQAIEKTVSVSAGARALDLSGVTRLDTAGALLLCGKLDLSAEYSPRLEPVRVSEEHRKLLQLVERTKITAPPAQKRTPAFKRTIVHIGKEAALLRDASVEFITFMGKACAALARAAVHPRLLRMADITHHIEKIGIDALPIIALISSVISIVIAYQGQVELRPLGAEQYTVNLIAISVLREMGVLLTAIMVAGRSGSAFTAEIGTMKIREEIDALRTIGFNPFELLVLPRIIALLIALPLLTFFADFMGLLGGALISRSLLDISLLQYLEQVRHAATWKDFFVGMIKSPVFAFVIALVGCMHGFKVSGSAENVGKETTASVVQAIFLVLMLDGIFSVYLQKAGI